MLMVDYRHQAVTGLVPPASAEAKIREVWPSVASVSLVASLGQKLTRTIILAPLAWLIMSAVYFGKLLPFAARRYTLTNRRLMIRRGWKGTPSHEIPLAKIDDIRVVHDAHSDFFRAGTLEVIENGKVAIDFARHSRGRRLSHRDSRRATPGCLASPRACRSSRRVRRSESG